MPLPILDRSFGFAIAITTLLACGGATDSNNLNQGGTVSTVATSGGAWGSGGAISRGGNSTTGTPCCNSRPYCRDGDADLGSSASCPVGAECYAVPAICCSPAIYCAHSIGGASVGGANAGGAASGGSGATASAGGTLGLGGFTWGYVSTEVVGGACSAPPCAPGYSATTTACTPDDNLPSPCYSVVDCGARFVCQKLNMACQRASDFGRRYRFADTTSCRSSLSVCPVNTKGFSDACGCGCEQASTCTEWVDCMPGPASQSPLCADSTLCPYTLRAL
jgi:hypothetical protein